MLVSKFIRNKKIKTMPNNAVNVTTNSTPPPPPVMPQTSNTEINANVSTPFCFEKS